MKKEEHVSKITPCSPFLDISSLLKKASEKLQREQERDRRKKSISSKGGKQ